jgi:nucleoside-diphosphate-sugar epimerase
MSERKRILLTGATGFLGSHLASRFLIDGQAVSVLARGSKTASARERVETVLQDIGSAPQARLAVFEGDISLPDFGLSETDFNQLVSSTDEVWHCAASLSFLPEDREEIFKMNVGGMRNVLDLVDRIRGRRLHHVSTAYIAGNRSDLAMENEINVGQTFKNPYEESKCEAELIVADAHRQGKAVATVYRPSIVIGDSTSGRVTHFHGVYAFIRGLWTALERLRRGTSEDSIVNLPLRLLGAEGTTLNFVPIDYVVDGMLAISCRADSVGETYHLVNPVPTENRVWLPNICRVLGVEGIQLVPETSFLQTPMTRLEQIFQKQMAFYYQYLQGEPRFDCRRTLEALKNTGIQCPRVTIEFIQRMMDWYVGFLRASRSE